MPEQRMNAQTIGTIALWILQVALAAYFVYSGYLLFGDDFVKKFDEIGFGQWLRYVTGVLEIAGAIGLLIPPLSGLAAAGLALVMIGATGAELFLVAEGDAQLPLILLAVAAIIAVGRPPSVKAPFAGKES